jgi:hypothetical protein
MSEGSPAAQAPMEKGELLNRWSGNPILTAQLP